LPGRRQFLVTGLGAMGALSLVNTIGCQGQAKTGDAEPSGPESLFSISLAEWSFHNALQEGEMTNLDFPAAARQKFGIDAIEYVSLFFPNRGEDAGYVSELLSRCRGEGVQSNLIMVDGEGALGAPDPDARTRAIENHHHWVDVAKALGCHSIRVNAESEGDPDTRHDLVVDGLRRLTEYGADNEINVIVENHGGISSNGEWLASVIRAVDHPRCGTLPDFGNFQLADGSWYDRYLGVEQMMPFAKAVSAKSFEFDEDGLERRTDYFRMMRIVLDAGYRGYLGIEYEGEGLSEDDGIRATQALLERVRTDLAPDYL
jgi:sugar phosphate isomerase/epimerase